MAFSSRYSSSSKQRRPIADINVTPMIDIMLVLMMIFMCAAPMMVVERHNDVILPSASGSAPINGLSLDPIVFTLNQKGVLQYKNYQWNLAEFNTTHIRQYVAEDTKHSVHIRADQQVAYGKVMQLLTMLKKEGYQQISLVTIEPTQDI